MWATVFDFIGLNVYFSDDYLCENDYNPEILKLSLMKLGYDVMGMTEEDINREDFSDKAWNDMLNKIFPFSHEKELNTIPLASPI